MSVPRMRHVQQRRFASPGQDMGFTAFEAVRSDLAHP